MKKRKGFEMMAAVVFGLLFFACEWPVERSEAAESDGGDTIAFFMPHLNTPFMKDLSDAVKKYAAGAKLIVLEYVADNDPDKQVAQIEEAVALGVKAMLLDPSSHEGITDGIKAARAAGIPMVTLHEPVSIQNECVSFVGSDFTDGGVKKMKQAMTDFPKGGNVAVVYGMLGHSAQINISSGYTIALRGYEKKYRVVLEGEGKWSTEGALELVTPWLASGEKIDAIVCNNDAMAMGALQAVTAAGQAGKIKIYGLDAQEDVLAAIQKGTIHATVFTDFDTEARVSIDILLKVMKGEFVNSRYMIPMTLITGKNVSRFIKK